MSGYANTVADHGCQFTINPGGLSLGISRLYFNQTGVHAMCCPIASKVTLNAGTTYTLALSVGGIGNLQSDANDRLTASYELSS